ncbi:hypothetical protein NW757_010962 [Fusarium falciforme]|nr:hypothetical protein NW757_010962 [Fusarium falciforme]
MASFHRGNTPAAEGDRPAEQPEGSSKNAIQSPTVDAAQNMEMFTELIPGLDQVPLARLNESENAQPSNHIRETDDEYPLMTWADLFDGTYSPWYEYRDAGCFGYVCPPAWDGLDWSSRVRGHKVEFLGIKDLEAAAISVLARVAPLIQKMEATTKLEKVD